MKNDYKIVGDTTIIYLKRRDGSVVETKISTSDLPKVDEFPMSWCATPNRTRTSMYVSGSLFDEERNKQTVILHRFIIDAPKGQMVDHINHDTLDNRRENLRLVTHTENQQNRQGPTCKSKSGVRGVCWHKKDKKWRAAMNVNKKRFFIGNFDDIHEAEEAIKEARKKHMPGATK